jgi:hypothetical protein
MGQHDGSKIDVSVCVQSGFGRYIPRFVKEMNVLYRIGYTLKIRIPMRVGAMKRRIVSVLRRPDQPTMATSPGLQNKGRGEACASPLR